MTCFFKGRIAEQILKILEYDAHYTTNEESFLCNLTILPYCSTREMNKKKNPFAIKKSLFIHSISVAN